MRSMSDKLCQTAHTPLQSYTKVVQILFIVSDHKKNILLTVELWKLGQGHTNLPDRHVFHKIISSIKYDLCQVKYMRIRSFHEIKQWIM